ncbi:MAG: DUF5811 family protein [Halobacteriales archaeon]
MHGNRVPSRPSEASPEQLRTLQRAADELAAAVRVQLTEAFSIDADVVATPGGPRGAVSVHPPEAPPVSAGLAVEEAEGLTVDRRRELAAALVVEAVGRARSAVGDRLVPAAQ